MISDLLSDCVEDVEAYLSANPTPYVKHREHIARVLLEMSELADALGAFPAELDPEKQ